MMIDVDLSMDSYWLDVQNYADFKLMAASLLFSINPVENTRIFF